MRHFRMLAALWLALAGLGATAARGEVTAQPITAGETARPFQFAKLVTRMTDGRAWGSVAIGLVCYPKTPLVWRGDANALDGDIDAEFRDQVTKAGFQVAGDSNNLFERDTGASAEYAIGGAITDLKMDICQPWVLVNPRDLRTKGAATMTVEWQIYSRLKREVVAKVTTTGNVDLKQPVIGGSQAVFRSGFGEAVKGLINSPEFRQIATNTPVTAASAGQASTAAAKTPLTFARPTAKPAALTDVVGSVVTVMAGDGHGSGFLISADGYVLTNAHVTVGSKYVKIRWSDGLESVGEVLREEKGRDVALVKTDSRGRLPLAMHRGAPDLGLEVYAIGAPIDEKLQGTVTRGIVSSSNRIFEGYSFIQSDVSVNPGNSGGPLVSKEGEVLGITVIGLGRGEGAQGLNLFIPAGDALDFLALKPTP